MQAIPETESVSTASSMSAEGASGELREPLSSSPTRLSKRAIAVITISSTIALLSFAVFAIRFNALSRATTADATTNATGDSRDEPNVVRIDDRQMSNIKIDAVISRSFLAERTTTGKIAFNEDVMTPVFSPYTGRVLRLLAKPGDAVKPGAPLFEIDTPDLVQAGQDLITASIAVTKAKSVIDLASRVEDRQHRLYLNKAVALKDWEQSEADVKNAERDLHSAESALAAARSRLRVFGKTDQEIEKIESDRQIDRLTRVLSPLAGTIVARKVGPGQYVKPDNPDPLFTIADLSTVWLLADVYEADVPLMKVGQRVEVHVAAYPLESFTARIAYVNPSVDPTTHRVALRSVIENRGRRLKPEMLAGFRVVTNAETQSAAVPTTAIVREGDKTSVWVAQGRTRFSRRDVTTGIQQGGYVQILSGLQVGERVVSAGGLLIGNAPSS